MPTCDCISEWHTHPVFEQKHNKRHDKKLQCARFNTCGQQRKQNIFLIINIQIQTVYTNTTQKIELVQNTYRKS